MGLDADAQSLSGSAGAVHASVATTPEVVNNSGSNNITIGGTSGGIVIAYVHGGTTTGSTASTQGSTNTGTISFGATGSGSTLTAANSSANVGDVLGAITANVAPTEPLAIHLMPQAIADTSTTVVTAADITPVTVTTSAPAAIPSYAADLATSGIGGPIGVLN